MKKFGAIVIVLTVACGVFAARPQLIFPDARIAHLKTPEGHAKVAALADAKSRNPVEALALAYRVTGDRKYAERIRTMLLRDYSDAKPGAKPQSWGGGLNGAHKCYDAALGYDSIYDYLTPAERAMIARNLTARAIEPMLREWLLGETRSTVLDSMGHNWWSSCVFLPGFAALAVEREEPRVKPWIDRIGKATVEWFLYPGSPLNNKPATFDPEGGFYESVGYGSYALSSYLLFRLGWQQARPAEALPAIPFFDKLGDFFLNSSYPCSGGFLTLNFGDSSPDHVSTLPLVLLWANGVRNPDYLWYLKRTADKGEKEVIRRDSPMGLAYFPTEAELAQAPAVPSRPTMATYKSMGWSIMRDSWRDDATMLGVKSGFFWNHAHADAGSFMLYHKGENLLIDSGKCWYPNPEYDAYYRQSQAHNVVLFDGMGANPEDAYHGSKFPGAVMHPVEAGNLRYILADATGPTAWNFSRNYRSFLWLDDVILIFDDLKTHRYGSFEWLIHTDGVTKRRGGDLRVTKNKSSVVLRPLFPEELAGDFAHDTPERLKLVEKSGLKDRERTTPVPYYAFAAPGKARVMKFVTAILLDPARAPQIERLQTANAIGARIHHADGKVSEVWMNLLADGRMRHRNANNTLGNWETDAYILCATGDKGKAPTRFFAANASYLRRPGEVLLNQLSKVFAVIENGKTTLYPR